jgi:radical S-adenosyl methionine domain-containing protein 2
MAKNGYVINLHLLEKCNYHCKHCFARFDSHKLLLVQDWKQIIDNITKKSHISRFNLAGGEPLLYQGLDEVIEYINTKNIQVSLITNGYLLSEERIREFKGRLSMLGISIDALHAEVLQKIGRCTKRQEIFSMNRCIGLCKSIKENNIQLKINTVVTRLNLRENIGDLIQTICPDRWKILKMKQFSSDNNDNSGLEITEDEFNKFCSMYTSISHVEEPSLKSAYIIVDSKGWLVNNNNKNYQPAANLLQEDFVKGFDALHLDEKLYESRYNI